MKVIDGKHYVPGGLACKECCGFGDAWDPTWQKGGYRPRDEGGVPCLVCHGTGLQAVEEWPDKVKAEWLVAQYLSGKERAAELLKNVVDLLLGGGNLSDLLTAAVIAVAEEAK